MNDRAHQRLRLSLKADTAMGLHSVHGLKPKKIPAPVKPVEIPRPFPVPVITAPAPPQLLVLPSTAEPFSAPVPVEEKRTRLIALDSNEVRSCTKCRLHQTRTQTVFGEGDPETKIFFIGEGPGETEDQTGRPFVGRAGQLLDKMILAMGLQRAQVYIANIVKCRPPENRTPAPDEVATCTPYLERQLEIIRPRVIVTLGRPATSYMLRDPKLTMGRSRGRWYEWRGIKLMPTFHPSYVLRSYTPETRKAVWSDLQQVMKELNMTAPPRAAEP